MTHPLRQAKFLALAGSFMLGSFVVFLGWAIYKGLTTEYDCEESLPRITSEGSLTCRTLNSKPSTVIVELRDNKYYAKCVCE